MARRQGETQQPQGSPQPTGSQAAPRDRDRSGLAQGPTARGPGNPSCVTIGGPTPTSAIGPIRSAQDQEQRVAQPRQRFPNPEDQRQASGVAVPRGTVDRGRPGSSDGRAVVYGGRTTRVYNNYYYYPRNIYPYGYGSYGLGYFYYDPYSWYDSYPYYGAYPYPTYYAGSGYYQGRYGYPTGEIRLQVRPRNAEVYVDGYYAGRVDDFDGFLQSLRIEEGPHTIEIVAPGYEPLVFNVRIIAGRKLDYRADLYRY
jgi:hypothetical protein